MYLWEKGFASGYRDTDERFVIGHSLAASEGVTDTDQCLRAVYLFNFGGLGGE